MSRIFGFYANDKDTVWYESSNVRYSKCLDHDNSLKTLDVVFNNGTQYRYKNVNVNDYLLFREDLSQGKALNKYIKANGYEYEKLEDANIEALNDELEFRLKGGMFVFYKTNEEKLILKDNKDVILLERNVKFTQDSFDALCESLRAVGKELYIDVDYPIDDKESENKIIEEKLPF